MGMFRVRVIMIWHKITQVIIAVRFKVFVVAVMDGWEDDLAAAAA